MEAAIYNELQNVEIADPAFQRKSLQRLKMHIMNSIDSFNMREESKSYFLHQLANVHDLSSMKELMEYMSGLEIQ